MEHLNLIRILKFLPGIIIGLTVHEYCHALIAQWCGDNTSKEQGRVSLNPLKHIDLFGFIMLLVAGFGWAKPVQFNAQNLKKPKTDVLKIAVAGPLSNAITAMILSMLLVLTSNLLPSYKSSATIITLEIMLYAIYINWGLFIFNLIPLPPLDGSHILLYPLRKFTVLYDGIYKYGSWALFIIIIMSIVTKSNILPIWQAMQFFGEGFLNILGYR